MRIETTSQQLTGSLELLVDLPLIGFAIRIVEFLRQQRLGHFRLFDCLLHSFQQIVQPFALTLNRFFDVFSIVFRSQAGGWSLLVHLRQTLRQLFLLLIEFLGIVSHLTNSIIELTCGPLSKLIPHFFELSFRPPPRGQCFRGIVALQCLACAPHVFASLFQTLARLGHLFLVFRLLHPFVQLVGLAQQVLLLVPKPLELTLDFFPLLFRLCFFECRLQLSKFFVQVFLAASEFTQAAEHLTNFAFLLFLLTLFLSLTLGFVAILILIQFQFIHLSLASLLRLTA